MKDKIAIGIIGTGKHGSRYATHVVEDLGDCFHLAAISRRSPSAQRLAENWQTRLYSDWRELVCSSDVDAVISVTTPNLHPEIAKMCANENKPLLLEKPLTTDYYSAKEIVDLFTRKSIPLTIGQTLRYNSIIVALKENFREMGSLYSLTASHRLEPSTMSWLEQPEIAGGGVIFHTAVHLFDALRFITGDEIVRIRASSRNVYNPQLEDLIVAELELENGGLGIVDTSKISPARVGRYEFICEKGQLHGDQVHGQLQKIEGSTITNLLVEQPGPTILPLLKDWYAYLKGKQENPISGTEGLAAIKICHVCREAAASGEWIEVGSL